VLHIIMVFAYNIYYAVRCLYTLHMYTANCLLLHFMLSYYQVMLWPAGLYFEQMYLVEISRTGGGWKFSRGISLAKPDRSAQAHAHKSLWTEVL